MDQEQLKQRLDWVLVVCNLTAGVVLVFTAFGLAPVDRQSSPLYLGLGVTCLVAGGAWLLNQGSSRAD